MSDDKLEKLTSRIYEEGIVKAQAEAQKIIAAAGEEKKKILRAAREEAEDILSVARREAQELENRVRSELKLAAEQSLALLRQKITALICVKTADAAAEGIFDDPDYLKKILELVIKEWVSSGCHQGKEFLLKVPEKVRRDLEEYLFKKGRQELGKGLKIEFEEKLKSGFVITPKDGQYRIGFTEDDFKALIQYFLSARIKEFLFSQK